MPNQITGTILEIGSPVNVPTKSGNPFTKRVLILDASTFDQFTGEKRENYPSFTFMQKRVEELNNFQVGQRVTVSFFISGRKWVDEKNGGEVKWFNDVVGYKIEPFQQYQNYSALAPQPQQATQAPPPPMPPQQPNNDDDLPF